MQKLVHKNKRRLYLLPQMLLLYLGLIMLDIGDPLLAHFILGVLHACPGI